MRGGNRAGLVARSAVAGFAIVILAGCATSAGSSGAGGGGTGPGGASVMPPSLVEPLIKEMPERSVAALPDLRLASGLAPPTNRWFSGLVFPDAPEPVFPLPLSFGIEAAGFGFGMPIVSSTPETIASGYNPAVTVDTGSVSAEISAYDDASVTVDQLDASGESIGSVLIAEGSPLVTFTAATDVDLTVAQPFEPAGDGVWASADGAYGLVTEADVADGGIALAAGDTAVWFAVPPDGDLATIAALAAPLEGVDLDYGTGGASSTTELTYRYGDGGDGLVAAMPHQRENAIEPADCDLGTYPSVYGTLTLCAGKTLSWGSPSLEASGTLDVASLDADSRKQLEKTVAADTATAVELPADTYFGGKALYRIANLLDLAVGLGDKKSAATLQDTLNTALRQWTEPDGCEKRATNCFVYDADARGMVGLEASFGADEFNDHHFHYGYFLYAASVAVRHDPDLTEDISGVINLLSADLATSGDDQYFAERRVFDAYAGHSWASGYSPFADGNNQESSSEAVTAWNGLTLWAQATDNESLEKEATWMLSGEAASANAYWTNFDADDAAYANYAHSIAPLNWGAKRDYSTWFSADANAKLGILALPMSPVAGYLGTEPARIEENLAEAVPGGYDVAFGDYLLMYKALGGTQAATDALALAEKFPDELLDDGNSRSYMLAWIMTR